MARHKWVLEPAAIVLCGTIADMDIVDIPGVRVGTGEIDPPHLIVWTGRFFDTPDGREQETVDWPLPPDWRARLHMLPEYLP